MEKEVIILMAEPDDEGFAMAEKSLQKAGVHNELIRFNDREKIVSFLNDQKKESTGEIKRFLLILNMGTEGVSLLDEIKQHEKYKKIPVVLMCDGNESDISDYYRKGCSVFIEKPDEANQFNESIKKIGKFLNVIKVPQAF